MKKSYQHIIKKSYTTPKIEEVMLDREMSLAMESQPIPIEGPGEGYSATTIQITKETGPDYGQDTYRSPDSPF